MDRDPPSDDAEAALPVQGVRPQGRDRPGWGGANVGFLLGSLKPLTGRLRPIVKPIDLMSRVDRPRRARVAPTPCGVDDVKVMPQHMGALVGMVFCVIGVFLVNWQAAAK